MKVSFIILAHQHPEQLQQLVDVLNAGGHDVFIHIDRKSKRVFQGFVIRNTDRSGIHIYSKYKVYWGSFSQIKATFFLLDKALSHSSFDFVRLLSGQDLPIRPLEDFRKYLASHREESFFSHAPLPDPGNWSGNGGLDRVELFWFTHFPKKLGLIFNRLNVVVHAFQKTLRVRRKMRMPLYGGANWFTLNREMAAYVSEEVHRHQKFFKRFRNTRCADEIILQTLLLNSPFRDRIVNDPLCYVDWQTGPEYPRIFTTEDLPRLRDACQFFARKFDSRKDAQVVRKVIESLKEGK